jgi:hypothetical protein
MHRSTFDVGLRAAMLLSASLTGTGCLILVPKEDLQISLDVSDTRVRPDAPITLTVTAKNTGDEVMAWGDGSSSCQLGAVVQVGTEEFSIDLRACTMDLVPQELAPGENRVEEWVWRGELLVQGRVDTLPRGEYRIQAMAGSVARSNFRTIRFEPPDGPQQEAAER